MFISTNFNIFPTLLLSFVALSIENGQIEGKQVKTFLGSFLHRILYFAIYNQPKGKNNLMLLMIIFFITYYTI